MNNTNRDRRGHGFTLVEVLIVVIILGILAAVAMASFGSSSRDVGDKTFASNLRAFAEQFTVFELRNGTWPAERATGVTPPEVNLLLDANNWGARTPIGGNWDWDYNQNGVTAAISVVAPDRTAVEMAEIDRIVDDGDVSTGRFRTRAGGYMYVIRD
jgi:prepilin-type N-terminal cleavage/methylation domain-containing protein